MFEIPKLNDEDSQYDGSRIFTWLADICGLSVDLINFLVCQILALFFATFFRSYLHTSKVTTNIRHAFGLSLGLYFGYFCFGQQAIHIVGLPAVCYIIIRTQNPQIVQRLVMVVSMIYLSMVHVHRMYFDYSSYALDITGPLMVITQKVTMLTFSIHDGIARNEHELTTSQKCHAIQKLPSALEYFAYVLHFQGLMTGPLVFYKDYIEFIEGTNFLKHAQTKTTFEQSGNKIIVEPSPMLAVIKKVAGSAICAYIFMNWTTVYPIKRLSEDDFLENTSILYKLWYMMMATTSVRFKYYHAWLLADAISNNSGLGFNGFDENGYAKWDLISNINVISFELATNLRDGIQNWNMGTNQWLRLIVYERVPKNYGTILTFSLSAFWHGFYAGYYITFASGALVVTAARTARKLFRYRFQQTEYSKLFYDILTLLTTRIFMGYLTFPFILLEFKASLRLYLNTYLCLYLVALITVYVLPRFIRAETSTQSKNNIITKSNKLDMAQLAHSNNVQSNGINGHQNTKYDYLINAQNEHIYDDVLISKCDINVKYTNILNCSNDIDNGAHKIDKLPDTIVNTCDRQINQRESNDNQHLSLKIRDRIVSETRNIEELIDKTVTGIVELKDDLMRVNTDDLYSSNNGNMVTDGGMRRRKLSELTNGKEIETFLRKEINNAVNQVNVLPAVLSNGHGD